MQVIIQHQEPQAALWRDWAAQRTHRVLRRLREHVSSARVRLQDTNGPRGGADKRCHIELRTDHHGTLIAQATDTHWTAAINTALHKLARQLSRQHHRDLTKRAPIPVAQA
jgi:ribosome-associated translation inhibitor RaiA